MDSISLAVAGGFRIVVPGHPKHLSTYVFLEFEDWFEVEAAFLRVLFGPGERMLDIGANLGFYSLTAAAQAGPGGRIWSFEPTPEVARRLRASVALNGMAGVEVVECALGARLGRARLVRGQNAELNRIDDAAGAGEDVALNTLDRWYADTPAARGITFVKLDVEGQEDAVIAGGAAFFAQESPLVMMEVTEAPEGTAAAIARLAALGYAGYRLLPGLGVLVPHAGPPVDTFMYNLFLAKPDRAALLAARDLLVIAVAEPQLVKPTELETFALGLPALAPHRAGLRSAFAKLAPDGLYGTALRASLASRNPALPAPARASVLLWAQDAIEAAVAERASISRLLSAARIALDVGMRMKAYLASVQLTESLLQGRPMTIGEPFLPMLPDYDAWTSPAGLQGWIGAMVVEGRWRWEGYSSYFRKADFGSHDPSDLLRRFGRQTPFLERRRMLEALIEGRSATAHPMLLRPAPDNLNPDYWSGHPHALAT